MAKTFLHGMTKLVIGAVLTALLIGSALGLSPLMTAHAVDGGEAPTFAVVDGSGDGYDTLHDGNLGTKYCIEMGKKPSVTFAAESFGTVVTGYTFYTGNDTSTHQGRNPKGWTLYGSNDFCTWTPIHTVTDDTTMGTADKTGYGFSFSNTTPYLFYRLDITARQGASGEDHNLMQLSEIAFTATVDATAGTVAEIRSESDLVALFANGGKGKLMADLTLTAEPEIHAKTVELDLNGYSLSGNDLLLFGASSQAGTVLILSDSRPNAAHADTTLPKGGVIGGRIELTRLVEDETYANRVTLFANGGTVTGGLHFSTSAATVRYFGDRTTSVLGDVTGCGGTLAGGLYYGAISPDSGKQFSISGKKVTFCHGSDVYAYEIVRNRSKVIRPTDPPAVIGCEWIGWYNGTEFDFSEKINSDLTINALYLKEVATYNEMTTAIADGYSLRLTADIEMTNDTAILKGKSTVLDLNGHILDGKSLRGDGNPSPVTVLVIIDSRPTATHEGEDAPKGGWIKTMLSLSGSSSAGAVRVYANGGTINKVYSNSYAGYICPSGSTPSVIRSVTGYPTVEGGLFYFNRSLSGGNANCITFMNGETVYAVEATTSSIMAEPIAPTKEGFVFDGWYNGTAKFNFTTPVKGSLTLTAGWRDVDAPVISGVDKNEVYCTDQTITVTDASAVTVTVNGARVELTDDRIKLEMSKKQADQVVVATDADGNSTTVTVRYGHHFAAWIAEVPATCTADGTKGHKDCSDCHKHFDSNGAELTELTLPAGHTFGAWIAEVPATCTEEGTKEYTDCTLCGKHFDGNGGELTGLTIPTTAHSFGAWVAEVAATETQEGTKGHKDCTLCGKHFDEHGVVLTDLTLPMLAASAEEDGSLSGGAVAAIAVGGAVVVGCGGFSLYWFVIAKKKWADLIARLARK